MLSNLKAESNEMRIDSEYFQKKYIDIYDKLKDSIDFSSIMSMSDVSSNGSFAKVKSILNDNNDNIIPYIRSSDVGDYFIDLEDTARISQEAHKQLKLSTTKKLDIIMARKGKIGGASIVLDNEVDCNCNENVIKLTIDDKDQYNPYYILAFLNSKYGIEQTNRISTGNVQPWISIYQIRKMKLIKLSKRFQLEIEKIIKEAYNFRNRYKEEYKSAEFIIRENLKIDYILSFNKNKCEKSFVESLKKYNRLDSEFFDEKYDVLDKVINEFKWKKLGEFVDIFKSIEPGSDAYIEEGIPFIRISNFSKFGIKLGNVYLDNNKYNVEELKPIKDTILLSKDGTIGIAYKVDDDANFITSSAILHLKNKDTNINNNYLTLLLNSEIVKLQAERSSGGSIIKHWRISDIRNVKVPILNYDIQNLIDFKIKNSFKLRKRSNYLLKLASKCVEIAIENDENKALEYLCEKLK
ncbi:hypothetical protein G6Y98_08275 [Clostridium perfringens]|uniref:restriction endonuclease subunit S n=2 Tax=Clostridium perfringens TaxID=1502 RepID=UPI0013E3812D|nr:restriction endonuclease subunit S [Clostridium perfringens]NGT58821.1 hypothetical protein [Clostridium perfringens]NGT95796.1 hypothetical protein [Clostridium perfringens]